MRNTERMRKLEQDVADALASERGVPSDMIVDVCKLIREARVDMLDVSEVRSATNAWGRE